METPKSEVSGLFQGASPKLTFVFGLIAGVAAAAIIGMVLLLPKWGSGSTKTTTTAAAAPTNSTTPAAQTFGNVAAITSSDYIRGSGDLSLVEYSDYECPFCKQFEPTIAQILDQYKGKVQLVYRQYPLSFHQNAEKEAEAGLCIGKLGGTSKFWDFTDKIFTRTQSNGTGFALADLGPLAKEVGVNQDKFQKCLDSGEMQAQVAKEQADGTQAGVNGTPTVIIVGKDGKTISGIPGAYPLAQVQTYIDQALAKS
ncbi:MAG: thioredoxin domain-containing protein [Candidatus Kerfeldbacteria bacterium]|nr:thioredoxin domain-containing protein [Candidatus Kerfeldbacteria bacterium]